MDSYIALWLCDCDTVYQRLSFSILYYICHFCFFTKYIYSTLKPFEMAESSSLIVQMDVDEAAIDEGLYSRQL